jgi:hypothetical protein
VLFEPNDPGDFFDKRNAQSRVMIRAECEPVVYETKPQPDRSVPTVRTRDEGVVDIIECGLHIDSPVGSNEVAIIGNIDAVIVADSQRQEQSGPSFVELVREVLRCHDLRVRRGAAAMLRSIPTIRSTYK